jgi:PAS domain S-box-containing protein
MIGRLQSLLAHLLIGSAIPLVLFVGVGVIAWVMVARLMDGLELEKETREISSLGYRLRRPLEGLRAVVQISGNAQAAREQTRYRQCRLDYDTLAEELLTRVRNHPTSEQLASSSTPDPSQTELAQRLREIPAVLDHALAERAPWPDVSAHAEALLAQAEGWLDDFVVNEGHLLDQRRTRAQSQASQSIVVISTASVLAVFLNVLLAVWAARSVTLPVHRLRGAANDLANGQLHAVPVEGPTELAELTVLFNHMAKTLTARAAELRRQAERYRTYVGATARILWTTDASGQVISDLSVWRSYTGQGADAVLGEGWLDAVHPTERNGFRAAWRRAVEEHSVFEAQCRLRSLRGEYRHFACRGVPIPGADGLPCEWVGTCTDITDQRQQEALRQAKEAAEAASQAKSEFLARMSHELRTPLNAVIGMSRMLSTQRFGLLNAKQADYMNDISAAGEHLLALINDILDLAKVEAGRLDLRAAAFPLAPAIDSVSSTLRPLAESKDVTLRIEPPSMRGTVDTDANRVKQILYNLLSNAIKFTPTGGDVCVSWEWTTGTEPSSPSVDDPESSAVRLTVRDTGIGIAPEDRDLIWDEFRQAKPAAMTEQPGTGLGLAVTRRLVGLLGGAIWMSSELGKGSTFAFAIPRRLPAPQKDGVEGPENGTKPLALIVEDHPPTNKLIADWLEGAGMTTASALDGESGLTAVRRLRPKLLVLDLNLPGMDGWQLLESLRADPATETVPVIILTMHDDRGQADRPEVEAYFVKPVDRDTFVTQVRDLLPNLLSPE